MSMRLGVIASLLAAVALLGCTQTPSGRLVGEADLPRRDWLPDAPPRAVVLAVHGFNDYSNAFAEFGVFAAEHGIAVHAYDQRGFGANDAAGRWPGRRALIADLVAERARLGDLYPGRPVYLLGESMGAAVIMAAMASGAALDADGVILTAPAVWGGEQLNPFYRATLWLVARVAPGLRLSGRSLGVMASDNLEALRGLSADPLFIKETRVDAIAGLVELMDTAYAAAGSLSGPLLILVGERDEIVPPESQLAMIERVRATPCTRIAYPEGWHLLLRDLQRRVVWQDILAWIDGAPLPSAALAGRCGEAPEIAVAARE
jgi:alpha-beta hydrolase superfamily lysophospholipase